MHSRLRASIGPRMELLTLAAVTELLYVFVFLTRFPITRYYLQDIDMGAITNHTHAAYAVFVAAFTALFALMALAWYRVDGREDVALLPWILGSGVVFALTLVFVYPITAIDIFAYVDQSWIMVHYHQNPIFVPPSAFPSDPLMHLADGWSGAGAPYGPLGLVIDAIPSVIVHNNLLANLVGLKLLFAAMVVGSGYLVWKILRVIEPRRALSGAVLVCWNPLVLFEGVVNGHNDMAMMLFCLFALLSVVEGDVVLGVILLAAACLIKFATLVLLPLLLVYGVTRAGSLGQRSRFVVLSLGGAAAVAVIAYAHFWQGTQTLSALTNQGGRYLVSLPSFLHDVGGNAVPTDWGAIAGRFVFALTYALALYLSTTDEVGLLRASFIALFALLAAGLTNVESWYGLWVVLLAAAVPTMAERAAAMLFAWGISLSAAIFGYEWVWVGLLHFGYFDAKSYLLAFLPATLVLAAASVGIYLGRTRVVTVLRG